MKQVFFAAALAGAVVSAHAQTSPAASAGAMFGARQAVESIDISPDGNHVVYVAPGAGHADTVMVADLATGVAKLVLRTNGDEERILNCNFAGDLHLICRFYGQGSYHGLLAGFTWLIALDSDGKNQRALGQHSSGYDTRLRQSDGDVIDWLPNDGNGVLMAREYIEEGRSDSRLANKVNGLGIDRIDMTTLKATTVESPTLAASYFITDGMGNVRIKGNQPQHGVRDQLSDDLTYNYRLAGSKDWLPFSTWNVHTRQGMQPIAVDSKLDCAYALKYLDGRMALYRVKLDGSLVTELVYKNDRVDVDGVARVGRGSRVIGVDYTEDKATTTYFDKDFADLAGALSKALPNLPLVRFIESSADGNKLLLFAGSDSDPGRYYVFDKAHGALNEIMLARPQLENVALATVKPITYPADDGTPIPAYLTLPPGSTSGKGLPAIVLPHGGPSARDDWGFDWLAQYFAHEGFAVLQPNYRGSDGFGSAWLQENGFKSWKTSISDVAAAGKWLVAQGIADPARLAIVGWSYGGYAALQSNVLSPGLFKATVAIAPVTDLAMLKLEHVGYTTQQLVADEVGDGPQVAAGSPLQNVGNFQVPVLMFHGDQDLNVNIEQSRQMDAKLRDAGKSSTLVEYKGLDHYLRDSDARAQMLDKIGAFLKANTEGK